MKSHHAFLLRLIGLTTLVATLAGCFGGARSIVPDYYLLTSRETQKPTQQQPVRAFVVGVGPVRVAPFLARQQIVTHEGGASLNILPQRWGEPLEQGIQRAVLQNLTTLTGAQGRGFPWRQSTRPHYAVRIDVIDLDRLNGNTAILDVSWVLEDMQTHRLITTQQVRYSTTIKGHDATALTEAYSDLLAQLSQRVALALNTTTTTKTQ